MSRAAEKPRQAVAKPSEEDPLGFAMAMTLGALVVCVGVVPSWERAAPTAAGVTFLVSLILSMIVLRIGK